MALVVDWLTPEPGILGARLADRLRLPRPDPDADRFAVLLAGGAIRIARAGPGSRERLANVSHVADRAAPSAGGGGARLLGVAWATVDVERAVAALAARFGLRAADFTAAAEERWLGAAVRMARLGDDRLVLLEPSTEGRLAAALARFGEGPVALYLGLPGPAEGAVREGPFGAGALVSGSPAWGPFAIVVSAGPDASGGPGDGSAGTIDG